jgi:SAM-dependent methyltransferase
MSSIVFDPAAEYYDRTRALDPGVHAAVIDGLLDELRGRGRVLEIGVGTGRIALDLHAGGVPMAGVDLSRPMLDRLVAKAGGAAPFPLAIADATALPFPAGAFGAAVACHVLHLVEPWREAVDELLRVVRPGGAILVDVGGTPPGVGAEVRRHFFALTGVGERDRPGLTDLRELDAVMAARGAAARSLPAVVRRSERTLGEIVGRLEDGIYAGCWTLSPEERRAAAAATRDWAVERYGPLDGRHTIETSITWRAYDVSSSGPDLDRPGREAGGQQVPQQRAEAARGEALGGGLDLGGAPPAVLRQQVQLLALEPVPAGLERRDPRREDVVALPVAPSSPRVLVLAQPHARPQREVAQPRLLRHLSPRRRLRRLAVPNAAPRRRPPRIVGPAVLEPDQQRAAGRVEQQHPRRGPRDDVHRRADGVSADSSSCTGAPPAVPVYRYAGSR